MARTKTKTFDCVEMKNRIQAKILSDYEAHKDEFPSLLAFIQARNRQSAWVRRMEKKFRGPQGQRT